MDPKELMALSEGALAEFKQIAGLGDLTATIALNDALKKATQAGPESGLSPMMLAYAADIQKNLKYMISTMSSLHTHAKNRAGEVQNLMQEVSKLK